MIKAIFFDIDGTLVSFKKHSISLKTKDTLLELKEKGIRLFVATGRSPGGLEVINGIDFDGYITLNGQYIYEKNNLLYEKTIDKESLKIIKDELDNNSFACGFEMITHKIYNYRNELVEELNSLTKNDNQPAGDISNIENEKVYQVQAFIDIDSEQKLMKKLPNCSSSRWYHTFCDINPIGSTKENGIDIFAKYYGFSRNETMAFGDGDNDISMIEHAGIGVAMGNATNKLKSRSDYITGTVDENGIIQALKHFEVI